MGCRRTIERAFQERDDRIVGAIVRAVLADWRHQPRAHLPDHFFPDVWMLRDIVRGDGLEHQAALLVILVVAREAVLIHERRHIRLAGARKGSFGSGERRLLGLQNKRAGQGEQTGDANRNRQTAESTQTHMPTSYARALAPSSVAPLLNVPGR